MVNSEKEMEWIKGFAYGLSAGELASLFGESREIMEDFQKKHAEEIQVRMEELEKGGWSDGSSGN